MAGEGTWSRAGPKEGGKKQVAAGSSPWGTLAWVPLPLPLAEWACLLLEAARGAKC